MQLQGKWDEMGQRGLVGTTSAFAPAVFAMCSWSQRQVRQDSGSYVAVSTLSFMALRGNGPPWTDSLVFAVEGLSILLFMETKNN